MNKPIFILGCHKSGTSLLRNLLDGTPGLFTIPVESHFLEIAGFWIYYALRKQNPHTVSFEHLLTRLRQMFEKSNEKSIAATRFGGDSLGSGGWNIERLLNHLEVKGRSAFEQKDYPTFFRVYFEAIHLSLKGSLPAPDIRYVEKSVENAEYAAWLKKVFPDASFIHIVRNPYAVLVSIRKFRMLQGRYPFLGNILDGIEYSFYTAQSNPLFVENYIVIRYEELILDTETKMKEIASFLGLSFDPGMLVPTALGEQWQGNSMTGEAFSGISPQPVTGWQKSIHPLEIHLVNKRLSHCLTAFNYQPIQLDGSPLRLVKGENIRTFIANRFLVYAKK